MATPSPATVARETPSRNVIVVARDDLEPSVRRDAVVDGAHVEAGLVGRRRAHPLGLRRVDLDLHEVLDEVGRELIKKNKAEASDHITISEVHVETKKEDDAEEEFIALPTDYNARAIALQTCTNMIVLKKCLEDTRKTVSLAAQKQIDKLNS